MDYGDLGMDPEILRRKAAMNGNGEATNARGILPASILSSAVKFGVDGLAASGEMNLPLVNGTNKIVSGTAA